MYKDDYVLAPDFRLDFFFHFVVYAFGKKLFFLGEMNQLF